MHGFDASDEFALGTHLTLEGPALLPGDLFDLGSYPGLRHGTGRVVAELYAILEPDVLLQLDHFEGVVPGRPKDSLYRRERIQLIEPAGTEAWVYFYNRRPAPAQRIASGDWRVHLNDRWGP